jgi:hypothetical protein
MMKPETALLELSVMNATYDRQDFTDTVVDAIKRGIPTELVTRLEELWEKTKVVAGEVINVGKIIVAKIMEFLKNNPGMALGIALGAVLGAMVSLIPFLGPLIAPLAAAVAAIYGSLVGTSIDDGDGSASLMASAISLANKFLKLFADIINSVASYWNDK